MCNSSNRVPVLHGVGTRSAAVLELGVWPGVNLRKTLPMITYAVTD